MKFAVLDIETTGLYHQGHGITEVSVVHVEGNKIELGFHRLLDPERGIPKAITNLTGIDENMIQESPTIKHFLADIQDALEGRVFVAHNVNFDYQFLKSAFESSGWTFRHKRFCTLRYARKLLPDLRSHKLSMLCRHFRIENTAKHRAHGDALATAHLLRELVKLDEGGRVMQKLMARFEHHTVLPANLDEDEVLSLPDSPGVYYFFGSGSEPIYIGKARSLKKRVLSHFTGAGSSRRKQLFQREVHRVEFRRTSTEYQALLLEDCEIKQYRPKHNRAQKDVKRGVAAVKYIDRTNKGRIAFVQGFGNPDVLAWFTSLQAAKQWTYQSSLKYGFDPRRAGLPLTDDFDSNLLENEEEAFQNFMDDCMISMKRSFALVDVEGKYFALVDGGRYRGYGVISGKNSLETINYQKNLQSAPDSPTARAVVRRMLNDDRIKCVNL